MDKILYILTGVSPIIIVKDGTGARDKRIGAGMVAVPLALTVLWFLLFFGLI